MSEEDFLANDATVAELAHATATAPTSLDASAHRLKSFVERIERLEEEKAALAADVTNIYSEAKATGFDVKALRAVIKLRRMDEDERSEHETLLDLYQAVLGMN